MIFENVNEEFFDNTDTIELTKEQYDMLRSVYDKSMEQLSKMSLEERIDWFRKTGFASQCSFEKEIGGKVYIVNAHFNNISDTTVDEHIKNIINREESNESFTC